LYTEKGVYVSSANVRLQMTRPVFVLKRIEMALISKHGSVDIA